MKVPVKEGGINRVLPQVRSTRERAIPKEAFVMDTTKIGNRIEETTAQAGKVLMERAAERQKEINAKQILDQDTAFRTEMQNVLYSTEPDKHGRPSGFMSRKLDQTQGATMEFDQTYGKLREKYLANVSTPEQQNALAKILDSSYTGHRDSIIRHETQQTSESIDNSMKSNIEIQANDAAQLSDGPSVLKAMDHAVAVQEMRNKRNGLDDKSAELELMDVRSKVAKSAFTTAMTENNQIKAQSIYEGVKGKVPAETEQKMKEEIESGIPYRIAIQDTFLDPIGARKKIGENLYGIKDPVKRKAAYDFAEIRAKLFISDSQEKRHDAILDNLSEGKLSLTDIENEMQVPEELGGMKKSILVRYQKALQGGIAHNLDVMLKEGGTNNPTAKAVAVKKYTDLIDAFIADDTDKWHAREQLAEAYSDGIVSGPEAVFLNKLKTNLKAIGSIHGAQAEPGVVGKIGDGAISVMPLFNTIKAVKSWMRQHGASEEELVLNIKQLLGTAQTGNTNPEEVAKGLMQNHIISKVPEVATLGEGGGFFADYNNNVFSLTRDGIQPTKPKDNNANDKQTGSK